MTIEIAISVHVKLVNTFSIDNRFGLFVNVVPRMTMLYSLIYQCALAKLRKFLSIAQGSNDRSTFYGMKCAFKIYIWL